MMNLKQLFLNYSAKVKAAFCKWIDLLLDWALKLGIIIFVAYILRLEAQQNVERGWGYVIDALSWIPS